MDWIFRSQLILFDFDGLLVNTEGLHYEAYCRMFANRGLVMPWSFAEYCTSAHYDAWALRNRIYDTFPDLRHEPWDVLYAEKKELFSELIADGSVELMPGVAEFLAAVAEREIPRCVVTHSSAEHVLKIRDAISSLNTIPFWITREDYDKPKPNSECYRVAIKKIAPNADRIVGFEDTPRGITALMGTEAQPVLVCDVKYPEISDFVRRGVKHYTSFVTILSEKG